MVPLPWGGALCSLQSTWGKHYRLGRCVCSRSSCFGMLVACLEVRKPWDSVQYLGQDLVRRVAGCPRWLKCEEWAAELDRGSPTKKWEPTPGLQDKGRILYIYRVTCRCFPKYSVCWPHAVLTAALGWRMVLLLEARLEQLPQQSKACTEEVTEPRQPRQCSAACSVVSQTF